MKKVFKFSTMKLDRNMNHILITSLMSTILDMKANVWLLCSCISAIYFEQLKRVIDSDAAMTEDLIAYNIIPFPLNAPTITNAILSFPEVRAAVSALKHYRSLPKLPSDFSIPETRSPDLMDFLHYVFGFQ